MGANDESDQSGLLEIVRSQGIPKLLEWTVSRYDDRKWEPGPKIDILIAREIAKLNPEQQSNMVEAFERAAKRNAEIRRQKKMQKDLQKAVLPLLEGGADLLARVVRKYLNNSSSKK